MTKHMISKALTAALPLVLGFLGGVSSTLFPSYFTVFCTGSI